MSKKGNKHSGDRDGQGDGGRRRNPGSSGNGRDQPYNKEGGGKKRGKDSGDKPQGKYGNDNNNRKNKHGDDRDERSTILDLSKGECITLSKAIKELWKKGQAVDDIVFEMVGVSPNLCPSKWRHAHDREEKLTQAVPELLKRDKLINHSGRPLPLRWPDQLQIRIASLWSYEGSTPEDICSQLRGDSEEYDRLFGSWYRPNAAAAIGHWLNTHLDEIPGVLQGNFIAGSSGSDDAHVHKKDADLSDDEEDDDSRQLLEEASQEAWAKLLIQSSKQKYDPNHLDTQWAFSKQAPKFGEPSRFVIRQAEKHNPAEPDPLPDPVRPVANAPFHPRKCQGTHGCSRHCTWNRDFHRRDGWTQHNYNNKYGIAMFMSQDEERVEFEDSDGDVIMADNHPPWISEAQDDHWTGVGVRWSRCLASEAEDIRPKPLW